MSPLRLILLSSLVAAATAGPAHAQSLGTFRWQLQPYCNVVTVSVTQTGAVYRLEGSDDRCGATQAASAIGTAFLNPDGSVGIGLNIVAAPDGQPVPVSAVLSLATLSGTWQDETGNGGAFVPTSGAGGGSPRPLPTPTTIPTAFRLLADGGFLAGGVQGTGTLPAAGAGARLQWHPAKTAFRAGSVTGAQWDEPSIGLYSTAMGRNTVASALGSVALGNAAIASGFASVAMGQSPTASGTYSVAMGDGTVASGAQSTAFGQGAQALGNQSLAAGASTTAIGARAVAIGGNTVATGLNSLAAGSQSQADGAESFALGLRVLAGGSGSVVLGSDAVTQSAASGSFVFADRSTTTDVVSFAPNEFIVRAAGGVGFYTNAALTAGVEMAAGGSSWAALSDVNAKENFRDVAGETVLEKLARMPIREWNYKTQDAAIRHMGPTAQDFRAAFGLGDFPLRINTIDADGVALAAVQALEARTRALAAENAALSEALAVLRAEVAALRSGSR
ncbi:MAG: tail fiber domain-containing protein [Vicinamibacterales bacterium]